MAGGPPANAEAPFSVLRDVDHDGDGVTTAGVASSLAGVSVPVVRETDRLRGGGATPGGPSAVAEVSFECDHVSGDGIVPDPPLVT